jgi:hypothetical protein
MSLVRPEIISAMALAVSVLSLAISFYMAARAAMAEKPVAWVKLENTSRHDVWLANIYLRNQSKFDLRALTVSIPIIGVPITKKQDFWMLEYYSAFEADGAGGRTPRTDLDGVERHLKLLLQDSPSVSPGETKVFRFWLVRSTISAASAVKMTFGIEIMKPQPCLKSMNLKGHIESGSIAIRLSSA